MRPHGKHGSRGMAVKVMDVAGDVLLDDGGRRNQDFLVINQPAFALADAAEHLRLTKSIRQDNDDPTRFFTPRHCLADRQPLGSINRLCKAIYLASQARRAAGAKDR